MKRPVCSNPFLQELAGAFHASLGLGNAFVSYYNYRKGNKKRTLFHLGIAVFEAFAFHDHWKERKDLCTRQT